MYDNVHLQGLPQSDFALRHGTISLSYAYVSICHYAPSNHSLEMELLCHRYANLFLRLRYGKSH